MEIGRRDAYVAAAVAHQAAHEAGGRASRLVAAEEDLEIGVVLGRVHRGHDPRQLRQTRRGDGPLGERDVLHHGRPVQVELVRPIYAERQRERDVVVQVLPDPREIVDDAHVHGLQVLPRSDPGEQQDLRGVDGAARNDYFPRGTRNAKLAVLGIGKGFVFKNFLYIIVECYYDSPVCLPCNIARRPPSSPSAGSWSRWRW